MKQNLSDVSEVVFRLLDPTLEYEAVVIKMEPGLVPDTKEPKIDMTMKITFPAQYAGVTIWDTITFEKALWKFKSIARACGLLSEDGSVFIGDSEQDFLQNVVRFGIVHSEWKGKPQNKVAGGYVEGYETPGLQG
jgi:hypothetical protein